MQGTIRSRAVWWSTCVLVTGCFVGVASFGHGQAQTAAESSPEALQLFQGAANLLQNQQFDLAAEEFDAFIRRFPKDPLVPKARYYAGVSRMQMREWSAAAKEFAAVATEYPKFELRPDALMNLGWCQYQEGQGVQDANVRKALLEQAAESFRRVITEYPQSKLLDQAHYFLGEASYLLGKYEDAAAAYRQVGENSPHHADSLYALGTAYEALQKWTDALNAYDAFWGRYAMHRLRHEVSLRKAVTLIQLHRLEEAEPLLEQLGGVTDFASADLAQYQLAYCHELRGDLSRAAASYRGLVMRWPQSSWAAPAELAAARCLFRLQQWPEARSLLERLTSRMDDVGFEAAHWLARLHLRTGQPGEAESVARAALAQAREGEWHHRLLLDVADALAEQPAKRGESLQLYQQLARQPDAASLAPQALYGAAAVAWDLQQYDQSLALAEELRRTFASDPLAADARRIIAECHFVNKQYPVAEQDFLRLIAEYPDHPDRSLWRLRLANTLLMQEKYPQVVNYLRPILGDLKEENLFMDACLLIAQSHFYQQQYDPAVEVLQLAMKAYPQSVKIPEMLLWTARSYQKGHRHQEAILHLETLLKDFPQSSIADQALFRLAESYKAVDNSAKAVELLKRVADQFPQSLWVPFALYQLGLIELSLEQWNAAIETCSRLLDKYPQFEQADHVRLLRAGALRQAGKLDQALVDLQEYLTRVKEPIQRADGLYEMAVVLVQQRKLEEALRALEEILQSTPQYARADMVYYQLAWTLRDLNRNEEALKTFEVLGDKYPDSTMAAEANFHIAENYYQNAQYDRAILRYEQARKKAVGDLKEKVLYKLGFSYYQLKKYAEAHQVFAEQVQEFGKGSLAGDSWFMQGECLAALEKRAEALAAYKQATGLPLSSAQMTRLNLLRGAQVANELENWQEALTFLDRLTEHGEEAARNPVAAIERATALYRLRRYQEAFRTLEPIAPQQDVIGVRARFMMGEILFAEKKISEAHREFRRAMYSYGGVNPPEEMKPWQVKAALEAGRCAEILLQQATTPQEKQAAWEEARKAYEYVTQRLPQSPEARTATARIHELSRLKF